MSYGYDPRQQYAPPPQGYAAPQGYAPQPQPNYPPQQAYGYPPSAPHQAYNPPPAGYAQSAPLFSPSSLQQSQLSPSHQLGGSSAAKMAGAATTGARDKWWILLFVLHLVFIFAVEGIYGAKLTSSWSSSSGSDDDVSEETKMVIGMLVTAAVIGTLTAVVWMKSIKYTQGKVIIISVVGNMLVAIASAGWYFSKPGLAGYGVFMLLWAGILPAWTWYVRDRIPLAEATLATSAQSLSDAWGPFIVTYLMAIFNALWTMNWGFSILAVIICKWSASYKDMSYNQSFESAAIFILIFSYYWTGQLVKNIVHFTTAGSVSSWWLVSDVSSPTWGSFKRAMTTSFGTIVVGSLLTATVQFLNWLARSVRCVCFCCMNMIERAMKWFNKYAMVMASMYGLSYFEAAKAVKSLMSAAFWDLFTTGTLTNAVFFMGNFLAGGLAAAISVLWTAILSRQDENYSSLKDFMPFLCFFIGYQMSSLFMAVLDSAVSTTLVCWAEDPLSMQRNRPEHFGNLVAAAQLKYPNEFAAAFPGLAAQPVDVQVQQQLPYYNAPPQYNPHQPPPHQF